MSENLKPLAALDFLVTTLIQHDRELTALGERLQESIRLLNQERLVEKYDSMVDKKSSMEALLEKMNNAVTGLQVLGSRMQKLESDSLQLEVSRRLSTTHIKTYQALFEEKGITAPEVAGLTHRSRATETIYLNQLVERGFVEKLKKGKKCYYTKVPLRQTASPPSSSIHGKVMILVMVSEEMSEDQKDVEDLVSHRLSDLKNWRIEKSTILSR